MKDTPAEYPRKHYGRDAGIDIIAGSMENLLATDGISCHMHWNKVEVNRDFSRKEHKSLY